MVGCAFAMLMRERDRIDPEGVDAAPPRTPSPGPDGERGPGPAATLRLPPPDGGAAVAGCRRCAQTRRTCPSCVQRRHRAWSLVVERGETCETAAAIMELDEGLVRQLVDAENDRRELRSLRCDSIPVHRTQAVIADALARDPDLRIADIACWLEMQQADFERAFLGRGRTGHVKRRVNVMNASRLMLALGRAPNELEGC